MTACRHLPLKLGMILYENATVNNFPEHIPRKNSQFLLKFLCLNTILVNDAPTSFDAPIDKKVFIIVCIPQGIRS